jgi:hypothetical protein
MIETVESKKTKVDLSLSVKGYGRIARPQRRHYTPCWRCCSRIGTSTHRSVACRGSCHARRFGESLFHYFIIKIVSMTGKAPAIHVIDQLQRFRTVWPINYSHLARAGAGCYGRNRRVTSSVRTNAINVAQALKRRYPQRQRLSTCFSKDGKASGELRSLGEINRERGEVKER